MRGITQVVIICLDRPREAIQQDVAQLLSEEPQLAETLHQLKLKKEAKTPGEK